MAFEDMKIRMLFSLTEFDNIAISVENHALS